jgi:hypothetical protein
MKILDEIKAKNEPVLVFEDLKRMCERFSFSSEQLTKMLTFFYDMGILIWINDDKLRDIVILDPVEYFVKPATKILCKHIATKDDPYHTVHCEDIHKACRKQWPEDWYQMLEFGLVSEKLAEKLLRDGCKDDDQVSIVLTLMERYGLLSSFLSVLQVGPNTAARILFLPAVAPRDPADYVIEKKTFEDYNDYVVI